MLNKANQRFILLIAGTGSGGGKNDSNNMFCVSIQGCMRKEEKTYNIFNSYPLAYFSYPLTYLTKREYT